MPEGIKSYVLRLIL